MANKITWGTKQTVTSKKKKGLIGGTIKSVKVQSHYKQSCHVLDS